CGILRPSFIFVIAWVALVIHKRYILPSWLDCSSREAVLGRLKLAAVVREGQGAHGQRTLWLPRRLQRVHHKQAGDTLSHRITIPNV
ncbi:MAG: hypothetical protein ACXVDA_25105, partial [Ktedonobacterales bacterium]